MKRARIHVEYGSQRADMSNGFNVLTIYAFPLVNSVTVLARWIHPFTAGCVFGSVIPTLLERGQVGGFRARVIGRHDIIDLNGANHVEEIDRSHPHTMAGHAGVSLNMGCP